MEVVAVVTGTHLLAAARRGVPRAAEANLYAAALGTGSADIVFFFCCRSLFWQKVGRLALFLLILYPTAVTKER